MEGRSPSICATGAPPHKPSKIPAHSAPERAAVVLCADKIDFYGYNLLEIALKATPHKDRLMALCGIALKKLLHGCSSFSFLGKVLTD
jgi:hypothetical protein